MRLAKIRFWFHRRLGDQKSEVGSQKDARGSTLEEVFSVQRQYLIEVGTPTLGPHRAGITYPDPIIFEDRPCSKNVALNNQRDPSQ